MVETPGWSDPDSNGSLGSCISVAAPFRSYQRGEYEECRIIPSSIQPDEENGWVNYSFTILGNMFYKEPNIMFFLPRRRWRTYRVLPSLKRKADSTRYCDFKLGSTLCCFYDPSIPCKMPSPFIPGEVDALWCCPYSSVLSSNRASGTRFCYICWADHFQATSWLWALLD